jgi:predicted nucleic acid-binding Zn ribbon protein
MAKRVAKPTRVSELLARYLKKAGLSARIAQAGVVEAWPELVGARIAANARAVSVRNDGVLLVQVRSAPWAQELQLMTPQIIARINAGRTEGRIAGIYWTVGRD